MIRIGIVGYGNIGRGVEKAVRQAPDMELTGIFTRRDPKLLEASTDTPVYDLGDARTMRDKIDVMILCGGSATDLSEQGPEFAAMFNTVDSFDMHAKIPEYLAKMEKAAQNTVAVISSGWDPGLFSMLRMLSGAVLPDGRDYTFWGYGVSQGHSTAVRSISGVKLAVQYSVPVEDAVNAVRSGSSPELSTRDKHTRECYVVAEDGADLAAIESAIKTMPDYFADYNTIVHFIPEDEFRKNHSEMPHGGRVFRSGTTGEKNHVIEFSLKLESNPEFTGSVMVAYARAAARLAKDGCFGAKTVLDIPLHYLSTTPRLQLIKELL